MLRSCPAASPAQAHPGQCSTSSPAPGGSTVQRDRRRGPSSWKAASESEPCRTGLGGVGIWCPF